MKLKVLGITGPIGCGKSSVARLTGELGAIAVIDADAIVRELLSAGTSVSERVLEEFGDDISGGDGGIDRARLAGIVFADPAKLRRLEAITHPAVRDEIRARVNAHADIEGVISIEAIRLLQSPLVDLVEALWIVTCESDIQRSRLVADRGYSWDEVTRRVSASPSFATDLPHKVISNNGNRADLEASVTMEWHQLLDTFHLGTPAVEQIERQA